MTRRMWDSLRFWLDAEEGAGVLGPLALIAAAMPLLVLVTPA